MNLCARIYPIALSVCSFIAMGGVSVVSAQPDGLGDGKAVSVAVLSAADFNADRSAPGEIVRVGLPPALADGIVFHLAESQRFVPVERTALRAVVREQREEVGASFLDRALNEAIDVMENVDGGGVLVGRNAVPVGVGAVGTTGALARHNDVLHDLQRLGSTARADYLIVGALERADDVTSDAPLPYGTLGQSVAQKRVRAKLSLRVINVERGTVAGVVRLDTSLTGGVFSSSGGGVDDAALYEDLARRGARGILDVTFPAHVVSVDPIVISRGHNDGVSAGDLFQVIRQGDAVEGSGGLTLGHLQETLGRVRVASVQKNISVVEWLDGSGVVARGDLVINAEHAETSTASASNAAVLNPQKASSTVLPKLAVGLVKSRSTAKRLDQQHLFAFTDTVLSRLVQTRRFQLIDRQEVDQLLTEQTAQALADNAELPSAMGQLSGADYLLYGSLANFSIKEERISLAGSNHVEQRRFGYLNGNMRIVNATTGEIIESREIDIKRQVPAMAVEARVISMLADHYADALVSALINAIYPIKVAQISGDAVYVNRGSDGGLAAGHLLDAFRPGIPVIDPDTGIELGREETMIGQIELTSVQENRSLAKVLGATALQSGDLLRVASVVDSERRSGSGSRDVKSAKTSLAMGTIRVNEAATAHPGYRGDLSRLTDQVIQKFMASNRFVVMERQQVDRILNERILQATLSDDEMSDSLRGLRGAEYFVDAEMTNLYLNLKREKVPYVDEWQMVGDGVAEGTFRVLDIESGAVKASQTVRMSRRFTDVEDQDGAFASLLEQFGGEVVSKLVSSMYPIKVLGAMGDGVYYINRGADGGVDTGDRYDVFRDGEELIDPDTGISFGQAQARIGAVEVVKVEPARAQVRALTAGDIVAGDVLRKAEVKRATPASLESRNLRPNW